MYLILPRAQLCAYEEHTRELLSKEPIRTNDGFDPVEVAGGGKNFARPKMQEFLFFLRYWNFMCLYEEVQRIAKG